MSTHDKVGYVYLMINPSMERVVKIGRTRKDADIRARDLRTTGVPKKLVVLWSEFVHDSDKVEKKLHSLFAKHRSDPDRESFAVQPRDAISALPSKIRTIAEKGPVLRCLVSFSPRHHSQARGVIL